MIDNAAVIIAFKIVVGHKESVQTVAPCATCFRTLPQEFRSAIRRNYIQDYARRFIALCAFQYALHRSFLKSRVAYAGALIKVHVTSLCADVGFVCFNFAFKLAAKKTAALQGECDAT